MNHGRAIGGDAGIVLVALLLSLSVSEIRREAQRLRDSENRDRLPAETASDAIVVIDETGEILYGNPMAKRLFGTSADELLGQTLSRFLPADRVYAPHRRCPRLNLHLEGIRPNPDQDWPRMGLHVFAPEVLG